jgi:GNAT superfamily N-acetyltransferase
MNDEIRIRTAIRDDAASLATLSEQLGYITSEEEILKRLPKLHRMEEHTVFVAISQDDSVLGWIHVFVSHRLVLEPFADLGGFVVAEGHRSQGIGERLLCKAEEWAVKMGLDTLRIRARSSRERAHHFYSRMGYQLSKEQKVFEKCLNQEKTTKR